MQPVILSGLTCEMRHSVSAADLLVKWSALPLSNTGVDDDFDIWLDNSSSRDCGCCVRCCIWLWASVSCWLSCSICLFCCWMFSRHCVLYLVNCNHQTRRLITYWFFTKKEHMRQYQLDRDSGVFRGSPAQTVFLDNLYFTTYGSTGITTIQYNIYNTKLRKITNNTNLTNLSKT